MKTVEMRRSEMLVRVRDFGRTYRARFPESSYAGTLFDAVEAAVKELGDHVVSRMSAARDGTAARGAAREDLIAVLEAMSRTARAFGAETAGVPEKFALPATDDDQALLAAGRLFGRDAAAYEKEFVGHGMPATFLADLAARIGGLENAIVACDVGRDTHVAARAAIAATIAKGVDAVHKIDALVHNVLIDDPSAMAVWERVRRVQYQRSRRDAAPAPEVPAPVGAPPEVTGDHAAAPPAMVAAHPPAAAPAGEVQS